jgi:hypothetical protein
MCAVWVFALGLFAASPSLHEQLHDGLPMGADHQCAIVSFANGVSVPLGMESVSPPVQHRLEYRTASAIEIKLESPRFLLQPERGPPLA